jgi:hypothetical protein
MRRIVTDADLSEGLAALTTVCPPSRPGPRGNRCPSALAQAAQGLRGPRPRDRRPATLDRERRRDLGQAQRGLAAVCPGPAPCHVRRDVEGGRAVPGQDRDASAARRGGGLGRPQYRRPGPRQGRGNSRQGDIDIGHRPLDCRHLHHVLACPHRRLVARRPAVQYAVKDALRLEVRPGPGEMIAHAEA